MQLLRILSFKHNTLSLAESRKRKGVEINILLLY